MLNLSKEILLIILQSHHETEKLSKAVVFIQPCFVFN